MESRSRLSFATPAEVATLVAREIAMGRNSNAAGAIVALLFLSGCSANALRCNVGVGIGLGADVQVSGLLHGGLLAGAFAEGGPYYGEDAGRLDGSVTLGLFHFMDRGFKHSKNHHMCFGLLPGISGPLWDLDRDAHPWAFELGVALLLVEFRIGYDPTVPFPTSPDERTLPPAATSVDGGGDHPK
jgi:hypothetical protein